MKRITVILLFVFFVFSCDKKEGIYDFQNIKPGKTLNDIQGIYSAILLAQHHGPTEELPSKTSKDLINLLITLKILPDDLSHLDRWGHELLIHVSSDKSENLSINGREIDSSVAVWSVGENGINEYGEGDDLASWKKYH